MRIADMEKGQCIFTQLSAKVLAVLARGRGNTWSLYIDAVPGHNHSEEWQAVKDFGEKQKEAVAIAIVENLFYPDFDYSDLEYY